MIGLIMLDSMSNPITEQEYGFSYCHNEEVYEGGISLQNYNYVIWILGDESTSDHTFNQIEQDSVEAFLKNGGCLFVSGSEIGWDIGSVKATTQLRLIRIFITTI